jgi:hypothetical protein
VEEVICGANHVQSVTNRWQRRLRLIPCLALAASTFGRVRLKSSEYLECFFASRSHPRYMSLPPSHNDCDRDAGLTNASDAVGERRPEFILFLIVI